MNLQDLKVSLFLAIRGIIRGSRGSLYLTVLIIAMVFINMIFIPSIILGFIKVTEDQLIEYEYGNILIAPKEHEAYIYDLTSLLDKINGIPGVYRAVGHYSLSATIRHKGSSVGANIVAVRPSDERRVTGIYRRIVDGSYLTDGETGKIIIGIQTSGNKDSSLDMGPTLGYLQSGESVVLDYTNGISKEYQLKGVIQTGDYTADLGAYVTWDEMELVVGRQIDEASFILVKTDPGVRESDVKSRILRFGVSEKVITMKELLEDAMGQIIQNFTVLNSITVFVSLIIAVTVLFIVIMIKTLSSRRQIGVLKAIGLDKSIIIFSYVFQVLIMTIFGVILGFILLEAMIAVLTVYPIPFPNGGVTPVATVSDMVNNTILLFIASFFAGYIPAWQVASEDIMTAMRS